MMIESFFKIIIPNYNNAEWIRKCLDSILNQTFKDYSVVVIDDLSTDNSTEVVESYFDKGIHIHHIHTIPHIIVTKSTIFSAVGESSLLSFFLPFSLNLSIPFINTYVTSKSDIFITFWQGNLLFPPFLHLLHTEWHML